MTIRTSGAHHNSEATNRAPEQQSETSAGPLWPVFATSPAHNIIAVLLVFCALYFAASLLVPIACAVLLSMMLAPPVRLLERLRVPRPLSFAMVVLSVMALLATGLFDLAGPAKSWIEKAPQRPPPGPAEAAWVHQAF